MDGVAARQFLSLMLAIALSGCGWFGASEEDQFDEDLPSLDAAITSAPADATTAMTVAELSEKPAPAAPPSDLRIPLRRRIEQTVSQGDLVTSTTLQLDFNISINTIVDDGGRRFGVHYDRVRYSGTYGGTSFEYDSESTGAPPLQALPFQGLVNNDFYFWIDQAGKIKLDGFDRFLGRCVLGLPSAERDLVLSQLRVISDEEGVARFVDDNIGLLGNGLPSQVPTHPWSRMRKLKGDVPTNILTNYSVESQDENDVTIKINGTISPAENQIITVANRDVPLITVDSGQLAGTCTIDRQTGLPKSSHVKQSLDMFVQLPDGTRLRQRKEVVITTERPTAE